MRHRSHMLGATAAWRLAGIVGLLLCLAGCRGQDHIAQALPQPYEYTRKGVATIDAFDGDTFVQRRRWKPWERITSKRPRLPARCKLRTEQGTLTIGIPDVGTLKLEPNTLVDLSRDRSINFFKKRRTEFPIFLERGSVVATGVTPSKGYLWVTSVLLGAKLIDGAIAVSGPDPVTADCQSGTAEVYLINHASMTLEAGVAIAAEPVGWWEMRVRATRGRVEIPLGSKRTVTLSADGFDASGRMCPDEVDILRD